MPIVRITSWEKRFELPADARNFKIYLEHGYAPSILVKGEWIKGEMQMGPFIPYCTYDTKSGLCLKEFERNGYHDSDFFMIYWDEEKEAPVTVEFATTRGWSYPALASCVDATPEVVAKYEAWKVKRDQEIRQRLRDEQAMKLRTFRKEVSKVAKEYDVSYSKLLKLRRVTDLPAILSLFGERIRSKFKLSLREQVLKWLKDASATYATPLSKKQMGYISEGDR